MTAQCAAPDCSYFVKSGNRYCGVRDHVRDGAIFDPRANIEASLERAAKLKPQKSRGWFRWRRLR